MSLGGSLHSKQTPPGNPEFVHLDSMHKCLVCNNVLRESMQTICGHRLCEGCIDNLFQEAEQVMCPAKEDDCEPLSRSNITPDPSERREVRNLEVYCKHREFGCTHTGKWIDLEDHLQKCTYKPMECPQKIYGCNKKVVSQDLEKHCINECEYRPMKCQYCKLSVPLKLQERHLQEDCLRVPLACPYHCGVHQMLRDELIIHVQGCPNKPKKCTFNSFGCQFMGTEQEVASHIVTDTNQHLELITHFTAKMEVERTSFRKELQDVTSERNQLRQQVNEMNRAHGNMLTQIEKLNKDNKDLKLKMVNLTERVLHLEKQSETVAKKDVVDRHDRDVRTMQTSLTQVRAQVAQLERQSSGGGGGGSTDGATVTDLKRRIDIHNTQFASIDVQMGELDLRFQILETASYDGTLMWKLRDYSRRKQDAVTERTLSLYSQPFYTHRYGYKMCARVYLNGDGMGKGSHLSLFFVIMRGEYDSLLPWPFQQKVTMILLDQDSGQMPLSDSFRPDVSSTSFQKPTTEMNIASGSPLFVSHTVLETPKYIKDDTLIIKFVVDLTNLNHP